MSISIDYEDAAQRLEVAFEDATSFLLSNKSIRSFSDESEDEIDTALDLVFSSKTQAFREVLLGSIIARIQHKSVDVRKPYVAQGDAAYSGRTLDERVVNPILQQNKIPCSKGPFLSVFRRSVQFDSTTREGLRDKADYDGFLTVIDFIQEAMDDDALCSLLASCASRFLALREASNITLTHIQRMSLEQVGNFISELLKSPSGGLIPVYLVVAAFESISHVFELAWKIEWQGINVADAASGVGGDIVVSSTDKLLMAAEVTERTVNKNRVVSTFNTKIGPIGIEDYLFFVTTHPQPIDTLRQAQQYFAQGHEINFVMIRDWIVAILASMGSAGRSQFITQLLELFDSPDTPATLKVLWNTKIDEVINNP